MLKKVAGKVMIWARYYRILYRGRTKKDRVTVLRLDKLSNQRTAPRVLRICKEVFLFVEWPLLEGVEVSDNQSDAIAQAFTDYIWERIQNE